MNNALYASRTKLHTGFTRRLNLVVDSIPDCPAPRHEGRCDYLESLFRMEYQTIRKWLNGTNMPQSNSLQYVADVLGVRLEWLMTGSGEMK